MFKIGPKLLMIRTSRRMNQEDFGALFDMTRPTYAQYENDKKPVDRELLYRMSKALNMSEADLTRGADEENLTSVNNSRKRTETGGVKIPFYDAIAVAGLTTLAADQTPKYEPAEFIDAGTWFRTATAAMRIAGDSMFPKYRPGCVVALREIFDKDDIDYGKDYVIETTENRWLKRLMKSEQGAAYVELTSYSTVTDQRGKLVHAPRDYPLNKIKRIYRVLGQVLHESGGEDILQRGDVPKMTLNLQEK